MPANSSSTHLYHHHQRWCISLLDVWTEHFAIITILLANVCSMTGLGMCSSLRRRSLRKIYFLHKCPLSAIRVKIDREELLQNVRTFPVFFLTDVWATRIQYKLVSLVYVLRCKDAKLKPNIIRILEWIPTNYKCRCNSSLCFYSIFRHVCIHVG